MTSRLGNERSTPHWRRNSSRNPDVGLERINVGDACEVQATVSFCRYQLVKNLTFDACPQEGTRPVITIHTAVVEKEHSQRLQRSSTSRHRITIPLPLRPSQIRSTRLSPHNRNNPSNPLNDKGEQGSTGESTAGHQDGLGGRCEHKVRSNSVRRSTLHRVLHRWLVPGGMGARRDMYIYV